MSEHDKPGRIAPYPRPAGGWDAIKFSAASLRQEKVVLGNLKAFLKQNQPHGFDCPGCAWPERRHTNRLEFCENGVKAVAAEITSKLVTANFFARHTVTELMRQSDLELEQHGRLAVPLRYDPTSDTYRPIEWDQAFALIAEQLHALDSPNQASFYASGRTSNEAAYLFQLFARLYGTNNFPDCSNMCHEATSRGLPGTVGIGKGTVTLEDFELADAILIFGQNPGTNHPRMLGELRDAARRGATIVSINPLRERGLERFSSPQHAAEVLAGGSTELCSLFIRPSLGGDFALIKAMAKRVVELDDAACATGGERVLDVAFIETHTVGIDEFLADLRQESWSLLIEESGVPREEIERLTQLFVRARSVIATWGMGITQHRRSVPTIQLLSNLMMLRGQIGRPGAGLCPVRGHSNVQGNRTVGIEERPTAAFLDRLAAVYGFEPPREHGLDVVATIQAMLAGSVKVFFGLGGNFVMAAPDTPRTFEAMRRCALTVQVATKLNRSHLVHGQQALLLPTLGRSEIDLQEGIEQSVTVEDSMSMVHLSRGFKPPASDQLLSEVAIIARLAEAVVGNRLVDWRALATDNSLIRNHIAQVFEAFTDYNRRVAAPGGFHLGVASRDRVWKTASGKAQFVVHPLDLDTPIHRARRQYGDQAMVLMTTRSHDQYNTTIYALDDRYRGVYGQRDVVFANRRDIDRLGCRPGDRVDLSTIWDDGIERRLNGLLLVEYDIPLGCLAAYFPEANPLVPLDSVGDESNTPTAKSIPVRMLPHLD
ncbi:FdhF/YdeP family oxidoreductase [Paludibacterium purpuratum]|uniref:Molybdopterin-dependent oxidoreductase alpha subunit n=1 Tax=Paludibacterium purpuratum TaxID=1144873 RepID=A0A4R7AZP7_9NEIS|nr:FdhF/YdeP family oxidoreductase [Paludibacterium purpuratum]TDR73892.1 molybdopterin-dependent oxidoreductase alpha subunit [Paludibacterium purpuratum]